MTSSKRFQQRVGTTTIYVTHDQSEGDGPRRPDCGDGEVGCGSKLRLSEVYDDPADAVRSKPFLGSPPMNLVPRDGHLVGFRPEHLLPEDVIPGNTRSSAVRWMLERLWVIDTCTGPCTEATRITRLPATVTLPVEPGEEHRSPCRQIDVLRCGHW